MQARNPQDDDQGSDTDPPALVDSSGTDTDPDMPALLDSSDTNEDQPNARPRRQSTMTPLAPDSTLWASWVRKVKNDMQLDLEQEAQPKVRPRRQRRSRVRPKARPRSRVLPKAAGPSSREPAVALYDEVPIWIVPGHLQDRLDRLTEIRDGFKYIQKATQQMQLFQDAIKYVKFLLGVVDNIKQDVAGKFRKVTDFELRQCSTSGPDCQAVVRKLCKWASGQKPTLYNYTIFFHM